MSKIKDKEKSIAYCRSKLNGDISGIWGRQLIKLEGELEELKSKQIIHARNIKQ